MNTLPFVVDATTRNALETENVSWTSELVQ